MNKLARMLIFLIAILLICPVFGYADIVYIRNADKLFGEIGNTSFTLETSYGKIIIKKEFLKSITFEDRSIGRWVIQSINNDIFSGSLSEDSIQFMQDDGDQKTISKEKIKRIKLDTQGPSYEITTAIFTMKNKDRFSGKLLDPEIKIQTDYLAKPIQPEEINRIKFIKDYLGDAIILLNNGDLIRGKFEQDQIRVEPDAISQLSMNISEFSSIQFNARKLVLKEKGKAWQSDKDGDGNSITDYFAEYQEQTKGDRIDKKGRSKKINVTKVVFKKDKITITRNNVEVNRQNFRVPEDILFEFDKYQLQHQYYLILDNVVAMLKNNPDWKIEIQGHADNIGTEEYNLILSEKRAQVVKKYLLTKGIERERLSSVGFGYFRNKASNETPSGRALNRRVEFTLLN